MGRPRIELTPHQKRRALAAREARKPWRTIAAELEVSVSVLRRELDEGYREEENAKKAAYMRDYRKNSGPPPSPPAAPRPQANTGPPVPLRPQYTPHTSITAILMGDPPPERSALGRRSET